MRHLHGPVTDVATALDRFESHHDVRVIAARDLGSRAWKLEDPSSDVDVRALFVQDPVEYATLDGYESALALDRRNDVEVRGWNVRRFAELVADSNPTAFEFLHSPLRYREFDPLGRLETDVGHAFEPLALYHHYRSLARRQYRKYLQGRLLEDRELTYLILEERDDEYLVRPVDGDREETTEPEVVPHGRYEEGATDRTVKRHLYVVRGLLYAQYVAEIHRFPELDFPAFLESEGDRECFDAEVVELASELVDRKRRGDGDVQIGRRLEPNQLDLPELDPADHAGRRVDRERIDGFVRETVHRVA